MFGGSRKNSFFYWLQATTSPTSAFFGAYSSLELANRETIFSRRVAPNSKAENVSWLRLGQWRWCQNGVCLAGVRPQLVRGPMVANYGKTRQLKGNWWWRVGYLQNQYFEAIPLWNNMVAYWYGEAHEGTSNPQTDATTTNVSLCS